MSTYEEIAISCRHVAVIIPWTSGLGLRIYEESLSGGERLLGDGGGPELAQCPDNGGIRFPNPDRRCREGV